MKLMFKKLSFLGFIALLMLGFVGCVTTTTVSELTDTEKVAAVLDGIDLGNVSAVSADLTLSTASVNGVAISWATSNSNVISSTGDVTIPNYTAGNQTVTLTVTATLNDVVQTKTFTVTVTKEAVATFLARAGAAIIIDGADNITANFNLPATSLGAAVTWVSSNPTIASIATTAVDGHYVVTVTRPQSDDGGVNTSITLTATVSIDSQTATVDKSVLVKAEAGSVHVTTIAEGLALALGTYITYEGMTIIGVGTDGFFFTDGTDVLFVYSSAVAAQVVAGGVYNITGGISLYNSIPEVQNIGSNVVKAAVSTADVRNITPTVATISQIIANHTGYTSENPMQFGVYSVTAKVYYDSALGNYGTYLIPSDASTLDKTNALRIYYKSNMSAVSALAGQTVTLTYVVFGYNSGASYLDWYGYFFGTSDDIEVTFADDQTAITAAFDSLTIPLSILEATTLDLPSSLYGVALTYASDNAAVINATTGAVDLTGLTGQVTVTITVTGTRGSGTNTRTFVVKVGETPLSTIASVYTTGIAVNEIIRIQGILTTATTNSAFWIQDATAGLDVYASSTTVQNQLLALIGQKVELIGKKEIYNGLYEITTITSVIVIDAAPTAITPVSLTSVEFTNEGLLPFQGQLISFEGFILTADPVIDATYGNVTFTLLNLTTGKTINVKYDSRVGDKVAVAAALSAFHAGDAVNIVGAILGWSSNKPIVLLTNAVQVVAGTAVTDADFLAFDAMKLPTTLVLDTNYTLPTMTYATITVKTISTELTAYIADGTTQLTVTSPESADAVGTVVFTLTKGTTTLDVTVDVTVKAITDAQKLVADQADLTVALTANEYDSVTLPLLGTKGTTVAWAITSGVATLDGASLTFDRTGANHDVVLTATLSIGTETPVTKEFTVAVTAVTVVTDISTLNAKTDGVWNIPDNTYLYLQATISSLYGTSGSFLQDSLGNGIYAYGLKNLNIGDEVIIYTKVVTYNSCRELTPSVLKATVSTGNTVVVTTMTVAELAAIVTAPYVYAGMVVSIDGLVVDSYVGNYVYLTWTTVDSTVYKLSFNYNNATYGWMASAYPATSVLPAMQFNFYNIYAVTTFNIYNANLTATDQQKVDYEVSKLSTIATTQTANFTLPILGTTGATIAWTSDNAAIAIDGAAATVTRPITGGDVVVNLGYTITLNAVTATGTIAITVTQVPSEPVEGVIYSTGFEAADGFTVSTVYNNTTVLFFGAVGHQWGTYFGTASTTNFIADAQSMQMRYYTSSASSYGYTYTNFTVADITKVVFTAKNYAGVADVIVSYSTDGGTTWTPVQTIDLTTTATEYTVNINSTGNTMIKFELSGTTVADRLTIDTVQIYNVH